MTWFELGYLGLFLACFLSATLLPLPSEGALIAFLVAGYSPLLSLLIATLGNTIGGTTNYAIGMIGNVEKLEKRVKNRRRLVAFKMWIRKYGYWLGLISWTPFIGDPLTLVIGYFRVPFLPFLGLMTIGKFLRYAVIILFWLD